MSGLSVTGGAAGLAADYTELVQLARLLDGTRTGVCAAQRAVAAAGDELLSAVLSGESFLRGAVAEALSALDPLEGPTSSPALACEALERCSRSLFAAAAAYEYTDESLASRVLEFCDSPLDHLATGLGGAMGGAIGGYLRPVTVLGHATWIGATDGPLDGAQALLTEDPGVVDLIMNDSGASLAISMSGVLPESGPEVLDLGSDERSLFTRAPTSVADLMRELALRDTGHHGEISVSFVVGADGRRRAIVAIPGTKSWDPLPNHDVTSVVTDLRAMAGARTAYEEGLFDAMRRAGVGPDDDVMLVGHSEGGIVAVDAARHADPRQFHITHVVTAGSPIGIVARSLPPSVQVLALENVSDIVPHTDGAANPVTPAITTVTADESAPGILASHSLDESYVPAAEEVDRSDDESIRRFLESAAGFLCAGAMAAGVSTATAAERPTMRTAAFWIRRR